MSALQQRERERELERERERAIERDKHRSIYSGECNLQPVSFNTQEVIRCNTKAGNEYREQVHEYLIVHDGT